MNHYLSQYDVTLTAVGPVFVGSGRSFSKKEYVKLSEEKIGIVSIEKLYAYLKRRNLATDFEGFMLNSSYKDLGKWFREHRIAESEYINCMQYELSRQDAFYEKGKNLEIKEFIKDPYGNPYIPGTTLKGMFRTILLSDEIKNSSENYTGLNEEIKREAEETGKINRNAFSRTIKKIEEKAFNTLNREGTKESDAVNDCMSGFAVSDSDPLSLGDLTLSQKIERNPAGTDKSLNILRECIRPGTEIHFTITVDSSVCKYNKDRVMSAISSFSKTYNSCFVDFFSGVQEISEDEVILGGGSGFVGKSCVYSMFDKNQGIWFMMRMFDKTGVSREHKHYMDKTYNVSPHIYKLTKYNGNLLPFGVCKVVING